MTSKLRHSTIKAILGFKKSRLKKRYLDLRRAGDRARDARIWPEAIERYERYLAMVPHDGPLWVQLGHSYKESGEYQKAETAYLKAQSLMADDVDLPMQIGHLYKLQGHWEKAAERYASSLRLGSSPGAYAGLIELGESALANKLLERGKPRLSRGVYLQVTDLLSYLEAHKTVSGIQRVQAAIIGHILGTQKSRVEEESFRFAYNEPQGRALFLVSSQALGDIAAYLRSPLVKHDRLRHLIAKAKETAVPVSVGDGDVFVLLGSFWGHGGSTELLRSLKAKQVRVGAYFYDIIPVTHPEFCEDALSEDFSQALAEIVSFLDFGLAISDFTRREVLRFLDQAGTGAIPIATVPLAHGMEQGFLDTALPDADWPDAIASLQGKQFVLCVGTIEARKNHRYLFDIWKALMHEGMDVPILLFVGRQGWRVDDLLAQLKATQYLDGNIQILHDLSDAELNLLYQNCLFTTFPSIVEGWGLPIGESLGHGKVCIASCTSAMPEVGGDLVVYIDPWNARAGMEVFRHLINAPSEIGKLEAKIVSSRQLRDWSMMSRTFIETVSKMVCELPRQPRDSLIPMLPSGTVYHPGSDNSASPKIKIDTEKRRRNLIFREYWRPPEQDGICMAGRDGDIVFKTNVGQGTDVIVLIGLLVDDTKGDSSLTASTASAAPVIVQRLDKSAHFIRINARTDDNGCVQIHLRVDKTAAAATLGTFSGLMVSHLGYAVAGDNQSWTGLLETMIQING